MFKKIIFFGFFSVAGVVLGSIFSLPSLEECWIWKAQGVSATYTGTDKTFFRAMVYFSDGMPTCQPSTSSSVDISFITMAELPSHFLSSSDHLDSSDTHFSTTDNHIFSTVYVNDPSCAQ